MTKNCDFLRFRSNNQELVREVFNGHLTQQEKDIIFKDAEGKPRPQVDYLTLCKELEAADWEPVCERPEFETDGKTSHSFLVIYERHSVEHHHLMLGSLARQAIELAAEIFKEEVANGLVG